MGKHRLIKGAHSTQALLQGTPAPSSARSAGSPVPGPSVNSSPWLKRTDGARRGAPLRDSEAEELPIPVRAACNVWLNFLSN